MREFAEHDEEDDEARHPRNHLVHVHDLVPEEGDEESTRSDDDDSRPAGDVGVDGVQELRAHDDIDTRPSQTSETVEDGDDLDAVV